MYCFVKKISDTVHGKFRVLRFKIIVFRVLGPCNLIGGTEFSFLTYCLFLPMACEDGRRMLLQNLHNHVPGYTVLYQDLIMNPHQYKQLTSCTKNIKNN
jgi:hypothetical protein